MSDEENEIVFTEEELANASEPTVFETRAPPPDGYMYPTAETTAAEAEDIVRLRQMCDEKGVKLHPIVHSDVGLLRVYRKVQGDLNQAFGLLEKAAQWRADFRSDTIFEWIERENPNLEAMDRYWPGRLHGVDRDGQPLFIERVGTVDVRSMLDVVPREDVLSYHVYFAERHARNFAEYEAKYGTVAYSQTYIEDFAGLSLRQVYSKSIQLARDIILIDQINYPNMLKVYLILNAPRMFSLIFRMISPFVDADSLAKVRILGADYRTELLKYVAPEYLPKMWGGECECRGPGVDCVHAAGTFSDLRADGTHVNPHSVSLSRRSAHSDWLRVPSAGSTLTWSFSSSGGDVGFSVARIADSADAEIPSGASVESLSETVPYARVPADKSTIEGSAELLVPGLFRVTFDNSFSALKKKTVTYRLKVTAPPPSPPDEHPEGDPSSQSHKKSSKKSKSSKKEK